MPSWSFFLQKKYKEFHQIYILFQFLHFVGAKVQCCFQPFCMQMQSAKYISFHISVILQKKEARC